MFYYLFVIFLLFLQKKVVMRKVLLFLVFVFSCLYSVGQPTIVSPTFPNSVGLFDLFEVSFTMGDTYSNPYDPNEISIRAYFISPDNTVIPVEAFYYEGYSFQKIVNNIDYYEQASSTNDVAWKVRFTPTCIGTWHFKIWARDASGLITEMPNSGSRYYTFTCTSVNNGEGFISKANARFLKRDVVKNGVRQYHSFFPIGPNIAWYGCANYGFYHYTRPRGIYEYEKYIDSLDGNANYMRIWLNRYQYLSLYGPEYTQMDVEGNPIVYFDSIINQKDSAELDYIITYAKQHGVSIMPCIFSFGDFASQNEHDLSDSSNWNNNPYRFIIDNPCEFFTDERAKTITKHLIRYIISRWGYATNIVSWEFWNEVDHMFYMCDEWKFIDMDVVAWHEEMADYVMSTDPYHHCVTTSIGSVDEHFSLYSTVFDNLDFVQQHNYQNIQNTQSKKQFSYVLYDKIYKAHIQYNFKPFFMGEFGFDQYFPPYYASKDPHGIDLHNSLWSSLFSTAIGPASFWWWEHLDSEGLFKRFMPILHFCENLPILSETFKPSQTGVISGHSLVFDNSIETYYMKNHTEDTIYGWCQDTAFAYQSLRWLTDGTHWITTNWGLALLFDENAVFDPAGYVYTLSLAKRPSPSSNSNIITIPIESQPIGAYYSLKWYNTETGYVYSTSVNYTQVQQDASGNKYVSITFPSFIRDVQNQTILNTFGDVVFSLFLIDNNLSN